MGAFCSILLFIILIAYAGYKISILEGKKSIDILQAVKENHFDDSYVFQAEQGINFAVAIGDFASFRTIDPSYGRIAFRKSSWQANDDGSIQLDSRELENHECSSEELGLEGTDHKFWPATNEHLASNLKRYSNTFTCVD